MRWALIVTWVVLWAAVAQAADAPPAPATSNAPIWGAVGVLGAALVTGIVALVVQFKQLSAKDRADQQTASAEWRQRQRELALKIVETIATDPRAARRFAVGLVKVEHVSYMPEGMPGNQRGETKFIPVNSRVTVGRDKANDIYLSEELLTEDQNRELSRYHCGFVANQENVVLEDYNSTNGTFVASPSGTEILEVNGIETRFSPIISPQILADRDLIWVGPFLLRYVQLKANATLSQ